MRTYGFLITTENRSLFVRTDEETEWARMDDRYTVIELVDKNEIGSDPDFDDYRSVAEGLYAENMQEIGRLKSKLEEFVEVVEAIVEIATPTDHIIENKAIIMLVNQQCRKLLESDE